MTEKILVTKSSMPPLEEYIDEIKEMWDTHWLTNMGPKHKQFQVMLKEYLSVKDIDLLTNGHMALELTMQALDIHGEVITTPFTFASTTHAIVRCGCTPVFCDINENDFTMDSSKIEELITDRTAAIMPVHVYGNVCDIETIEHIAEKYQLKVIYDAAHAFGVRYKGKGIGSFGDASCFSFHATKVFNSIEGGAVCFTDAEFGRRIGLLKNFGIHGPEKVETVGPNAKMNEFCAAMGICNLRHIDDEIAKRKNVVEHYIERLSNVEGIRLNQKQEDVQTNYAYFPVLFEEDIFGANRDDVFEALAKENIKARKYFYPLTNTFDCYHGCFDVSRTPVALQVSRQVLTLPLYADLPLSDVDRICDIIMKCKR
ncbi:MAG: DegT/DnrJ/EryC1/StrS family aminotransferase [Lachnospiraceae bacterium]|nr:DegT/DnrJ/EryC1/StrS family aminotransferase [Lachnospiraceae bacterium]